jgi:ubiquinone/menaquinone biosynthesis C-methylase UbiE
VAGGRAVERIFSDFSDLNRVRKARRVIDHIGEHDAWNVLIVGTGWRGLTEIMIGTAAGRVVYSDLSPTMNKRPYVCADGLALPFPDRSFDLVFSNAVIEHVGGKDEQLGFVAEHRRVAAHCVVTTPNRWFPIESHTRALLRHWSPSWRRRAAPTFTRLLSLHEFRDLLPADAVVEGHPWSATFLATFAGVGGPEH